MSLGGGRWRLRTQIGEEIVVRQATGGPEEHESGDTTQYPVAFMRQELGTIGADHSRNRTKGWSP